jgi:hypothetical protein
MSLSHYRHSQLRRIEASLRRSDPKLAMRRLADGPSEAGPVITRSTTSTAPAASTRRSYETT